MKATDMLNKVKELVGVQLEEEVQESPENQLSDVDHGSELEEMQKVKQSRTKFELIKEVEAKAQAKLHQEHASTALAIVPTLPIMQATIAQLPPESSQGSEGNKKKPPPPESSESEKSLKPAAIK